MSVGRWTRMVTALVVIACVGSPATAGAALLHQFADAQDAQRAANGDVLVSGGEDQRVYRIAPDGSVSVAAGSGPAGELGGGFAGDGGPATSARLSMPTGIEPLPDGGFLIADTGNDRIRRVRADGTIRTVAGGGSNKDGCLATHSRLERPESVAVTPDGGMIIGEVNGVLRRVWPDGSITSIAKPWAASAPYDVAPAAEGGYLVAFNNGLWKIDDDGQEHLLTEARDGHSRIFSVAPARDGTVFFSDFDDNGIFGLTGDAPPVEAAGGFDRLFHFSIDPQGGFLATDVDGVHRYPSQARPLVLPPTTGGYHGTGGRAGNCDELDPSFGGGGDFGRRLGGDGAESVVVQPGGRIVAAGEGWQDGDGVERVALLGLAPGGAPDPAFGDDGVAELSFADASVTHIGLAVGVDGGLVEAVEVSTQDDAYRMVVARFRPDGRLDDTFGDGGLAKGPQLWNEHVGDVAVEPGGAIVVAAGTERGMLTRFEPDGRMDASFGGSPDPDERLPQVMALQPDGKILTATGADSVMVTRYTSRGRLDPTFGDRGVRIVLGGQTTNHGYGAGLALQPDGKIVATAAGGPKSLIARLDPDGTPDPGFGDGGRAILAPAKGADSIESVAVLPGGDIVAAGFGDGHQNSGQALVRLTPDGRPRTSFGVEGWVHPNYGWGAFRALAVQPDGKVVAAAATGETGYVVARYLTGDTPAASAGGSSPPAAAGTPVAHATPDPPASVAVGHTRWLRLGAVRSVGLRRLLGRGLIVRGNAVRAGQLSLRLKARSGRSIAARTVALRRGGPWKVRLRVTRAARKRLRPGRHTLVVTLSGARAIARVRVLR